MEDIIGTTNQVTGFLKADPKHLTGPGTAARLEVNLASFKTGIEMRDGAVAKALGAAKNPVAIFTVERIKSASASSRTTAWIAMVPSCPSRSATRRT